MKQKIDQRVSKIKKKICHEWLKKHEENHEEMLKDGVKIKLKHEKNRLNGKNIELHTTPKIYPCHEKNPLYSAVKVVVWR